MAKKNSSTKIGNTKVKGATAADKQTIAAAKRAGPTSAERPAAAPKRQVTKRADQAPEAKASRGDKTAAADRLFKDADEAARAGLPPDLTREQHENMVRRAATGL